MEKTTDRVIEETIINNTTIMVDWKDRLRTLIKGQINLNIQIKCEVINPEYCKEPNPFGKDIQGYRRPIEILNTTCVTTFKSIFKKRIKANLIMANDNTNTKEK